MHQTVAVDSVESVVTGADPLSGRISPDQLGVGWISRVSVSVCIALCTLPVT